MDLREMKKEIPKAQEKLLKIVKGSEELWMPWWRKSADVFFLQFKDGDRKEEEIVVEER